MKKGFTLIELISVIVVLALVSIISVPMILNVISESKISSAKIILETYIKEVEKALVDSEQENYEGLYEVNDLASQLKINFKTKISGIVSIDSFKEVKEIKSCINKLALHYDNLEAEIVNSEYCNDITDFSVSLTLNGVETNKNIGFSSTTTFDLSTSNLTGKTNIICDNNAVPSFDNNVLTVNNIFGSAKCFITSSVFTNINSLETNKSNIVMINNETLASNTTINIDKSVGLDLNGYTLSYMPSSLIFMITNFGTLNISDIKESGIIKTNYLAIKNEGILNVKNTNFLIENPLATNGGLISNKGTAIITGGNYTSLSTRAIYNYFPNDDTSLLEIKDAKLYSGNTYAVMNDSNGIINIINAEIISEQAGVMQNTYLGTININGGKYIANNDASTTREHGYTINIASGKVNIKGNTQIINKGNMNYTNIGIRNNGTGRITITSEEAVIDSEGNYVSGVYIKTSAGQGIRLNNGELFINGLTIRSGNNAITNVGPTALVKASNIDIKATLATAFRNENNGSMYLCDSKIDGIGNDIYNQLNGYIHYKNTILVNNKIYDNAANIPSRVILSEENICD